MMFTLFLIFYQEKEPGLKTSAVKHELMETMLSVSDCILNNTDCPAVNVS